MTMGFNAILETTNLRYLGADRPADNYRRCNRPFRPHDKRGDIRIRSCDVRRQRDSVPIAETVTID
jgi:hypothetical protein